MADIQKLIAEHIDWVYGIALRQTRDAHLAEDIAQAVFLVLHRKRPDEDERVRLTGWLFRTTTLLAREALRKKIRRDYHERQAAMIREVAMTPADDAGTIVAHLDAAVRELPASSRDLILLRFYRGLPFAEVAQQVGLSENAAKKRVGRALDRLQSLLARRGVTAGNDLGAVLAVSLAGQAPVSLKTAVVSVLSGSAAASPGVMHLCKVAAHAALKPILAGVTAVIIAAGTTIGVVAIGHSPTNAPIATPSQVAAPVVVPTPTAKPPTPVNANLVEYRFVLPDGKPAADALVFVTSGYSQLQLSNLVLTSPPENAARLRADAEGRIRIPPLQRNRNGLYVLHPDGYLLESPQMLQKGVDQPLMSWGRIEGTVTDASGPLAGRTVTLWTPIGYNSVSVQAYNSITTDAAGRFVLDRVIPGDICRLQVSGLPWSRDVRLLPGETLPLTIAETGATVTARVEALESPFVADYPINFDISASARENSKGVQYYDWAQLTLDKRREFLRKAHEDGTWSRYVEDLNRNFASGKTYAFSCMYHDANVRLPNVPPGAWHAKIQAHGYDTYNVASGGTTLDKSLGTQDLDLAIAEGQTSLNLGQIKLRPMHHLLVGDKLAFRRLKIADDEIVFPVPGDTITIAALLTAGYQSKDVEAMYNKATEDSDVEFIEFMLGDWNKQWIRHRQAKAAWPQVHIPYWFGSELRHELGLLDNSGTPIFLAFSGDGTLLARAMGSSSDITKLVAEARERLADPAKLKSAEVRKTGGHKREQITQGADSNHLVLTDPQPKPQVQPVATSQPTPERKLPDVSLITAAQTMRYTSLNGNSVLTDRSKGFVAWADDGRYVFADGMWYCVPKTGKAVRYPCTMKPDEPHEEMARQISQFVLNDAVPAPDRDKVVAGEKWRAISRRKSQYVYVDEQLRIREMTDLPFGPARPEDADAWKLPAESVDLSAIVDKLFSNRKADKTWTYDDTTYALYRLSERKSASVMFAVVHHPSAKQLVFRCGRLQDDYQLKRTSDKWLCVRFASLSAAPLQIDWYYATPATIAPELAGDLQFYMHPFSRPYTTRPDGTMTQAVADPESIRLPLPAGDQGPDLDQLATDVYAMLSQAKDLPVKTRVIQSYFSHIPFNDGTNFGSLSEISLPQFKANISRLAGSSASHGTSNTSSVRP